MQLAKNWTIKERFRLKFSLDFFNLFNHANFNAGNLETANFNATGVLCGAGQICTPTNNVISAYSTSANAESSGFGQANAVQPGREIQYSLKFTF
jgi:hypothetical protein